MSFKVHLTCRSSPSEVFSRRRVFCECAANFRGVSVRARDFNKVEKRFVEIVLLHCCSPVCLLLVCRASSSKNTSGGLLLNGDNF